LLLSQDTNFKHPEIKHQHLDFIQGQLSVLFLETDNVLLFNYKGETPIYYNYSNVYANLTYIFEPGSYIKVGTQNKIYYNEVIRHFMHLQEPVSLVASEIKFRFPKSDTGIEAFSFEAKSGQLVGIMGISGAGKSTLLNLLNGTLPLQSGIIYLNGIALNEQSEQLSGLIGYVPQDDLIIEELTVFQNLYYNARMCFGDLSNDEITDKVNQELKTLDIYDIRNLPAGNPLNKFISGGQRKRLNIALETIRKPAVLFMDEPTSGLSSSDSEKIIDLLKSLTFAGNLIFINIHQPSSNIFKKLDMLMVLDKGGHSVYYGNPVDALTYFRKNTMQLDLIEGQCPTCKTVHPSDILHLIELKTIDETGQESNDRLYSPADWYKRFRKEINKAITSPPKRSPLPEIKHSPPGKWKQFGTYLKRNLHIKISDKQFIAASLFITPILGFILSFFVKSYPYENGIRKAYTFAENFNIPSFIFMAVVVPLFIGLSISAQEIFKDRKILKREHFLNLSWGSYLNSKITVLFALSAIQSLAFVLIIVTILQIEGMFWSYFLVLFSLSCLSNLVGLLLSATVKSIITIYILIPLILIPQLLFSGVIIPFDKINYHLSTEKYVPLVADFMPSRWGYEAIMVQQFTGNAYQEKLFKVNQQISNNSFFVNYTYPRLITIISQLKSDKLSSDAIKQKTTLLINELVKLEHGFDYDLKPYWENLNRLSPSNPDLDRVENMLNSLKSILNESLDKLAYSKDSILAGFSDIVAFRNIHDNYKVGEVVRNSISFERILLGEKSFIRKYEPIYQIPDSPWGRTHFYSATKQLGNYEFHTLVFNVLIIWIMTILMYFFLLFKWYDKLGMIGSNLKQSI
jgi:ABC-type multidrug transport system ATPase subunit/ABC-type multidrug transport system permease subunit